MYTNNCTVLHSSVLYCIKRGGWKRKKLENKREPTFTGPLQVWPMVYILYLFVARGHCTSVYILIQLLLTLLILVLSYRHITTLDWNHFFPVIIIPRFGRIFSKHTSKEQSNGSNTEATLILCGYSRELANIEVPKEVKH